MATKKFSTRHRVYWADCDAAGILYFARFFHYFEMAEEELFASLGRPRGEFLDSLRVGFPRAEAWARFFRPLRLGDQIEATAWIGKRTRTALVYHFELRREGDSELAAEGHYRVVCVRRDSFRPIPWPQEVLDLLQDYLPPLSKHSAVSHSAGSSVPPSP